MADYYKLFRNGIFVTAWGAGENVDESPPAGAYSHPIYAEESDVIGLAGCWFTATPTLTPTATPTLPVPSAERDCDPGQTTYGWKGAISDNTCTQGACPAGATCGSNWIFPDRACNSNNSYGYVGVATGVTDYSYYISAQNFGFSIPSDETIAGIIVRLERDCCASADYPGRRDQSVVLNLPDDSLGSEDKKVVGIDIPDGDTFWYYGGSTDLWSEVLTYADINDVDFGVNWAIRCIDEDGCVAGDNFRGDSVQMKVCTTGP